MTYRPIYNTIVNKYPSKRNDPIKGCWRWLEGRRADDGAEGLWRVHDKLYDMKGFIDSHPGGKEWLLLTEGTDITEVFESTHIYAKAKIVLEKYYVRDATTKRNYRLTFEDDGFYQTLKRKIVKKLPTLDKTGTRSSKIYIDTVFLLCFVWAILAMRASSLLWKGVFIMLSGLCISLINPMAHNFIHQRNNFRMYFSNLSLYSWRDWRVFHVMSHHPYPNSYADLEISIYEPYFKWIPIQRRTIFDKLLPITLLPMYVFGSFFAFFQRHSGFVYSERKEFHWDDLIAYTVPAAMFLFSGNPLNLNTLIKALTTWSIIILFTGFFYAMNALNAGHHGTKIVHEGDEFKSLDFGLYQLVTTIDRIEANSNLFMTLSFFGNHTMHHLFPTLDHALLPQLHDVFMETCKEFELQIEKITMIDGVVGQFQQMRRTKIIKVE